MAIARKMVGYCTACGGDCFDEERHRCPRKQKSAAEIVAVKFHCDNVVRVLDRRAWAKTLDAAQCVDLRKAIDGLLKSLGR